MTELSLTDDQHRRLRSYHDELLKWQKKINLISRFTVDDAWQRHFVDSLQLIDLIPEDAKSLIDFGSGAGFPAIVLAHCLEIDIHVIESDQRKCSFMRHVSRETSSKVTIHNDRIEKVSPFSADVITSRALASLDKLLEYAEPFLSEKTILIFPKGKNAQEELTLARKSWNISLEEFPSVTDREATIFRVSEISKK